MLHYQATNHDVNGKPTEWKRITIEQTKGLILTYFDDGVSQWDQSIGAFATKTGVTCFVIGS